VYHAVIAEQEREKERKKQRKNKEKEMIMNMNMFMKKKETKLFEFSKENAVFFGESSRFKKVE
jgi:hypothetical protein